MEHPHDIQNEKPPLDVQSVWDVRSVFRVKCAVAGVKDERQEKQRQYLIQMGEKPFPVYEAILSDPMSDSMEVCGVLWALWYGKANPHRFLKYAVSRLLDEDFVVRVFALRLLERIGSPAEAPRVVARLSDQRREVAYTAAKTLAAIGGPNEVIAMDVWLRGVSHRDDRQLREHVQKCRDELKKRLAAKKDTKK